MWTYNGLRSMELYNGLRSMELYNVSDKTMNHNAAFSIHCKRCEKIAEIEYYMMTIASGNPCIGFCQADYSPETFTPDDTFNDNVNGITYIYLGNRSIRAFTHNSICTTIMDNSHDWHHQDTTAVHPYNIFIRMYKQKAQFRYDEFGWTDFGNYILKDIDYCPYAYLNGSSDVITDFKIIKEKSTKNATIKKPGSEVF